MSTEQIPQLASYDEAALAQAFAALAEEVRASAAQMPAEEFRLHWLGRKQGRLKLVSEAWLKTAPPDARKPLGIRFNELKQQIERRSPRRAAAMCRWATRWTSPCPERGARSASSIRS